MSDLRAFGAAGNAPVGGSPGTAGGSSAGEAPADTESVPANDDQTATTTGATVDAAAGAPAIENATPDGSSALQGGEDADTAVSTTPEQFTEEPGTPANDNAPLPGLLATGTE